MIGAMRHVASRSLVGRAAEMAVLEAAFAAAGGGDASVVLVGGEAGVGKTRLVAEMAADARAAGALVAVGACVELTAGTAPYLAATDALRDLSRALGRARVGAHRRRRAARARRRCCPGAPAGRGAVRADDASRARLFGQVHDLVTDVAARAPLLLILEDVHWADRSTLDLAGFLARAVRGRARRAGRAPTAPTRCARRPALRGWLAELGPRGPRATGWSWSRSARGEVTDLLAAILGTAPDPRTAAAIAHRSGGNAFLAEELLAAASDGDPAACPSSVRDVLRRAHRRAGPGRRGGRARGVRRRRARRRRAAGRARCRCRATTSPRRCARPWPTTCWARTRDGRLSFRHELVREAAYADAAARRAPAAARRVRARAHRAPGAGRRRPGDGRRGRRSLARRRRDAQRARREPARGGGGRGHPRAHRGVGAVRAGARAVGRRAGRRARRRHEAPQRARPRGPGRAAGGRTRPAPSRSWTRRSRSPIPVGEPVRTGVLHSRRAWCSWAAGVAGPATYEHHTAALRLIPADPPSPERAQAVTDLALHGDAQRPHAKRRARRPRRRSRSHATSATARLESLALNVLGCTLSGARRQRRGGRARCARRSRIAREAGGSEEVGRAYVNLSETLDVAGRSRSRSRSRREGEVACNRLGLERLLGRVPGRQRDRGADHDRALGRGGGALVDETLAREVSRARRACT